MSTVTAPTTSHAEAGHGQDHAHAHSPFLAHHFDTPEQQMASGKLGMWAFLATELLMFGGLFCAYAVYRHNHPDVFLFAHAYLDKILGGINTGVLIASSFTMAWAVRASQLGQKQLMRVLLALTFLGGVGFLCIKFVEYKAKWEHFIFPGHYNAFVPKGYAGPAASPEAARAAALHYWDTHLGLAPETHVKADENQVVPHESPAKPEQTNAQAPHVEVAPGGHPGQTEAGKLPEPEVPIVRESPGYVDPHANTPDAAKIFPPFAEPAGLSPAHAAGHHFVSFDELPALSKERVNTFFGVYFIMTGLHGVHVLVGMGIIAWLFFTSGKYGPEYYTPVDIGGLYWHLVDLIWIFLFPLLYLIH